MREEVDKILEYFGLEAGVCVCVNVCDCMCVYMLCVWLCLCISIRVYACSEYVHKCIIWNRWLTGKRLYLKGSVTLSRDPSNPNTGISCLQGVICLLPLAMCFQVNYFLWMLWGPSVNQQNGRNYCNTKFHSNWIPCGLNIVYMSFLFRFISIFMCDFYFPIYWLIERGWEWILGNG